MTDETKTDIATIRLALSLLLKFTDSFKYGGLLKEYEFVKRAIEALDRLEAFIKNEPQQLELL